MGLNAKEVKGNVNTNRVEQPILDPGVYPGRLVQLIDLGLQPQRAYEGKDKPPAHEVMYTYELSDAFMVDEDGNELEDKPRWISETLPFYGLYADKAKSTQRYHALDPNGIHDGDFSKCIGTPVNVTIVNNKKGDKVYTNVANIASMRPRDANNCPDLVNEPKVFDLDVPDLEVFNSLPQWIQDKIKNNLNFKGSVLEKMLAGKSGVKEEEKKEDKPVKQKEQKVPEVTDDDSQDNPW